MFRNIKEKLASDGFVVLEGFLTNEEVATLKTEAEKLVKSMPEQNNRVIFSPLGQQQSKSQYFLDSGDNISYFFEEGAVGPDGQLLVEPDISLNKIAHTLHKDNREFRKVTFDERVKETCFQLGFEEPAVVQSMYIFKNPGVGSEVKPHQDASYLYTEPVKLVGFWIALDDATLENGCLWFAKGSHKSGTHRRYIRNPDKDSEEFLIYDKPVPIYPMSNFTAVPVNKGTCVLIHGEVVHYSPPNKSSSSRHAYTFHVIERKDTKYAENNWLQLPEGKDFLNVYKTF